MSKRQDATPLRDRLAAFARRLTLTPQEHAMVAAILLSMLAGSIVMHYRREHRLQHALESSPTPQSSRSR